jgi:hypothetical protein
MLSGPENIQFFFGSQVVGYFEDQPPSSAGQYRYMPFRGPGHLCLVQELARKGPQYCHYIANGETRYFTVACIPSVHVLEVSELVTSPVSQILESM